MNYFAHGREFVDNPYFLAGTAIPDWLNVADRRVRVRSRSARPYVDDDPRLAAIARGVMRHHADDAWFHETQAFVELSLEFTVQIRDLLAPDPGFRPSFLGHILVELLLDASLIVEEPSRLEAYYRAVEEVDAQLVQAAVARMAPRPADRLGRFVALFSEHRFLWDYLDDGKLCFRLNQVLARVKLPPLPDDFCRLLPDARRQVESRREELLTH